MTHKTFNTATGKYELEFVNQQFHLLMSMSYDDDTQNYKLDCSLEEANRIAESWGGHPLDLKGWQKLAREKMGGH